MIDCAISVMERMTLFVTRSMYSCTSIHFSGLAILDPCLTAPHHIANIRPKCVPRHPRIWYNEKCQLGSMTSLEIPYGHFRTVMLRGHP